MPDDYLDALDEDERAYPQLGDPMFDHLSDVSPVPDNHRP
jgi:hypothetical protein